MKIIRIGHCQECPYHHHLAFCYYDSPPVRWLQGYPESAIPDWCPLEGAPETASPPPEEGR